MTTLPLDRIIPGNCIDVLNDLPHRCADIVFADPPYNLQLSDQPLHRNDAAASKVETVTDAWDRFDSLAAYDEFTRQWLTAARRVLKDTGTIWVMGSYHNIYRVGAITQDLGYWFLNDVVWVKSNPLPQMRGTRFTNAHETLLWAQRDKGAKYTFNYHSLKAFNDGKQMRSDWTLPICQGKERLRKEDGATAHPTQKPEALLYRVILSSTNPGDVVVDPFFGTGTSGAVAKRLHRHFIGIEQDARYIEVARQRLAAVQPAPMSDVVFTPMDAEKKRLPRVPFGDLLAQGYLLPGQQLRLGQTGDRAVVTADGRVAVNGPLSGSIHQVAKTLLNNAAANGWQAWQCEVDGQWVALNELRQMYRDISLQL